MSGASASAPGDPHEALYQSFLDTLRARHAGFRIVRKSESPLSRVLDRALRLITGGRQSSFLDRYITTLGARVYVPDRWDAMPAAERYCIMRHEAVHIAQFRRFTWPGMALIYLLLPVPVLFAGGRALIEWEAYRETLAATWEVRGPAAARDPALAEHIVRRFTGPDYVWMWVRAKTIRRAIGRTLDHLEARSAPTAPAPASDPRT
ncbi:MAG: hypothetical protein H6744_01905 [Deltaproteobacteria bacterium]|nr:hypothetical protein [Deltaproteobacteria bacterium]MCB9785423.1 hypothetical protein [Deltaproteobacteria bacterium]